MRHAVIMGGGAGTRLWPLSRKLRPKQLLRLFDGASLLRIARQRLEGLFPPERIWVVTSAHYLDQVAAELPDLPPANLIGEPTGRDTANAIGLAAALLARRDPDATMAVFTADHLIGPQDQFSEAIRIALDAAECFPDSLITFGIRPTSPHTGYGYVRCGQPVGPQTYKVAEFNEKPTREVAETYLRSGDYFWNSGMFVWRVSTILAELERCLPDNARVLAELAADWDRLARAGEAATRFEALHKISIDFGVMEKAASVLMVEMNCRWQDVGSWASIASTREPDGSGNIVMAPLSLTVDSAGNIVVCESDHLVVLVGVSDLAVIHSDDATLVCQRDAAERLKELVGLRRERFGDRFE
jgi:mannose-1-phosphate guanylyltransferase